MENVASALDASRPANNPYGPPMIIQNIQVSSNNSKHEKDMLLPDICKNASACKINVVNLNKNVVLHENSQNGKEIRDTLTFTFLV